MRRVAALVAVTALLSGGCGGSGGSDDAGRSGGLSSSSTSTTAAVAASASPPRQGSGAADQATAPGRYTYATNGTFSSLLGTGPRNGESTLTVSPTRAGEQRSLRTGPGRAVEQVLRLQGDGTYVVMLKITDSGFVQEVRPSPPLLALPAPAPVGRSWSWATTTVDGGTSVHSSFTVSRTEPVTVGTEQVPTTVVEATVATTGAVVSTSTQTFWYSPRHRLIVQQQETTTGRVGGIDFRSESRDTLGSTTPV